MIDRTAIINHIQELLRLNGSREIAEAMFEELDGRGWVNFDETDGYSLMEISESDWMEALEVTDSADRIGGC